MSATTTRSFSDEDVELFLDNECDHMERCNLSDDHPFDNPWHTGAWEEQVQALFEEHRDNYIYITDRDAGAFLRAVGSLALDRGYDDGIDCAE